jgi:hypothetical protein
MKEAEFFHTWERIGFSSSKKEKMCIGNGYSRELLQDFF